MVQKQTRSILAILSTDISGYTEKTEKDESYAFRLIAKHRDIINRHVTKSNGFTFKEMGDGTFNKFDSAIDASRCAIKIQSEAIERNLPLRVGVHLGDVLQEGDDILGVSVNIADRIQSLAKPGTIYISDDIFRQIKNQPDLNTVEVGKHELKGIKGEMTLHELVFNQDGTITERIEVTHKIHISDEDGNTVEKETPKNEFLKTLTMFFFDNKTNNSDLDWLQYGMPAACYYTLQQEKLIVMHEPHGNYEYFGGYSRKSDNESGLNIPSPLKKKITNQQNKDYWISGEILNHDDGYCVITELYDAKLGKLLEKREFIGNDIFTIIDNIALQLRYDLKIPSSHIESTDNLSICNIYTDNIEAFKLYTIGKYVKNKNPQGTKETLESAVKAYKKILKHDDKFAIIYKDLAMIYLFLGRDDKRNEFLEETMSLLYKFPEPLQYDIKSTYFKMVEKNPDKEIKLYELWTKLQPHNIRAHKKLANAYEGMRDVDKALKQLLIVFSMTPSDFNVLSDIVDIYKANSNFDAAENLLKDYAKQYPNNFKPYSKLGMLYEEIGGFDKAKEQYEIVSLMEPNINDITLAKIETKFGKFDLAINQLTSLYKNPKKSKKRSILRSLSEIHQTIGQLNKSIQFSKKLFKLEET